MVRQATDQSPAAYRRSCDMEKAPRQKNHRRRGYGKENNRQMPSAHRQCGGGGETKKDGWNTTQALIQGEVMPKTSHSSTDTAGGGDEEATNTLNGR